MKAKVIETGEIVEVYHESQHGQTTIIYKEAVFLNGRMWKEDELDFSVDSKTTEVDLEQEKDEYWNKLCDSEFGEILERDAKWFDDIAQYFFELGLKAQKGD